MDMNQEHIKELVRERYGARAQRVIDPGEHSGGGGCGPSVSTCCGPDDMENAMRLYSEGQLSGAARRIRGSVGPAVATLRLWLGCNPGNGCWDLGSGGGIDCFLAAQQVGDTGHVTGLDNDPVHAGTGP